MIGLRKFLELFRTHVRAAYKYYATIRWDWFTEKDSDKRFYWCPFGNISTESFYNMIFKEDLYGSYVKAQYYYLHINDEDVYCMMMQIIAEEYGKV